jgi:hypothetical protein
MLSYFYFVRLRQQATLRKGHKCGEKNNEYGYYKRKNKFVLSTGSVGKGRKLLNAIIKTLFK